VLEVVVLYVAYMTFWWVAHANMPTSVFSLSVCFGLNFSVIVAINFVVRYKLNLSSPVIYTSKHSEPCWSNPPCLIFQHSGTLALRTEFSIVVPKCQKF